CRARSDRQATPDCQHASAATVDDAVTKALFTAIAPEELKLAIAAAGEVTARRQRVTRAAELAAERARYQADRAERAFLACEPENRLVARAHHQRQGPQTDAARPPRRHHPPASRRPRQAADRTAVELRHHRGTAHRA